MEEEKFPTINDCVCSECGQKLPPEYVPGYLRRVSFKKQFRLSGGGYVYIADNDALGEDMYKIGMTALDPRQRIRRLSESSAIPAPFMLRLILRVNDVRKMERGIQQHLKKWRRGKEFFKISQSDLERELSAFLGKPLRLHSRRQLI